MAKKKKIGLGKRQDLRNLESLNHLIKNLRNINQ